MSYGSLLFHRHGVLWGVLYMLWLFQVRHLDDISTGKDTSKREQNKGLASIFFKKVDGLALYCRYIRR